MNNLLVGVLCNKIKPDLFSTVQGSLPFNLLLFTNRGINWEQRSISGLSCIMGNGVSGKCASRRRNNQRYTQSSATAFRLEREIGRGRVFNMRTRFNKLITYSILKRA